MKKENTLRESSNPKHPCVKTQLTPEDVMADSSYDNESGEVTEEELVESVIEINPDINSMDSRG